LSRVEVVALPLGVLGHRDDARARGDAARLVGEQLGGDVLVVDGRVERRAALALRRGEQLLRVGRDRLDLLVQLGEEVECLAVGVVALRPAAAGRERHHRPRPAARRELERHVAAQRVADDVRGLEARVVHRPLELVGDEVGGDLSVERRAAGVADERRGEHVVMLLELRQHEVPGAPGVHEAVEEDERRAGAAAVEGGELGGHLPQGTVVQVMRTLAPTHSA